MQTFSMNVITMSVYLKLKKKGDCNVTMTLTKSKYNKAG